jgi:predicted O-methyltransferase YrrM
MLLTRHKNLRLALGVLETFNLLTLKLALRNRRGLRHFPGEQYRSYMSLAKSGHWQSRSIFEIFPDSEGVRITLEHLPQPGMNARPDDIARLAFITQIVKPKKVFEIGTFRGRTALNFALNSPPDCTVYTLDLPPEEKTVGIARASFADRNVISKSRPGLDYEGKDVAGKIRQLYGNSQTFDFTPFHGEMDLVYVDGAHDYEAVLSDTMAALRMLKPDGILVWDDLADYGDYNDVTRAVLRLIPAGEVIQVDHTHIAVHRPKKRKSLGCQAVECENSVGVETVA